MMMKKGIFAGHSSLALLPLHLALLALASLAHALLALNPLAFVLFHSPLPCWLLSTKIAKYKLEWQNAS